MDDIIVVIKLQYANKTNMHEKEILLLKTRSNTRRLIDIKVTHTIGSGVKCNYNTFCCEQTPLLRCCELLNVHKFVIVKGH